VNELDYAAPQLDPCRLARQVNQIHWLPTEAPAGGQERMEWSLVNRHWTLVIEQK
jgi:hypothetical protein